MHLASMYRRTCILTGHAIVASLQIATVSQPQWYTLTRQYHDCLSLPLS
jgi:hypothetical protein